jgi:hypothetical protein
MTTRPKVMATPMRYLPARRRQRRAGAGEDQCERPEHLGEISLQCFGPCCPCSAAVGDQAFIAVDLTHATKDVGRCSWFPRGLVMSNGMNASVKVLGQFAGTTGSGCHRR